MVVVAFELVDIDHQQRQGFAITQARSPFGAQAIIQNPAVGHACQAIHRRQITQGIRLPFQRQMGLYSRFNNGGIHRLADKIHSPGSQRGRFFLRAVLRGHENHRNRRSIRLSLELPADFQAVHIRHQYIKQHQIRLVLMTHRQRFLPAGGHKHFVVISE